MIKFEHEMREKLAELLGNRREGAARWDDAGRDDVLEGRGMQSASLGTRRER